MRARNARRSCNDYLVAHTSTFCVGGRMPEAMMTFVSNPADATVWQTYDKYLKSFQYTNALDAVLRNNRTGLTVVSLLQELVHRDGLRQALAGRDELSLDPIVRFLIKYITYPRYSSLLIDVTNDLLDIYGTVLGQSTAIGELLGRLRRKLAIEIKLQSDLQQLMGSMDMLMATSGKCSSPPPPQPVLIVNGIQVTRWLLLAFDVFAISNKQPAYHEHSRYIYVYLGPKTWQSKV